MDTKKYNHILDKQRPKSKFPKMDRIKRAAQFAPFKALSTHEESKENKDN